MQNGIFFAIVSPFELEYDMQFIPTKGEIGVKIHAQTLLKMQTQVFRGVLRASRGLTGLVYGRKW